MPSLTIDGKQITVESGTTIMKAAEKLGIDIPHFCYHPQLSVAANCRICLVEVEKVPKLQTACSTPVTEGMVVKTSTPRVARARQAVMEFLLINHPLDCPICDQAGECRLQDYSYLFGQTLSRFCEKKIKAEKRSLGEHVLLHPSRCIKCTRCIRFYEEILGREELALINRGNHAEVATYEGRPLTGDYSANVVDLCPVGALTLKEFRFKERVWLLNQVESICPACSKGCNVIISGRGQKILRIKPRPHPEVNACWMCDEGRFCYPFVNDPARLKTPLVRSNGQFVPISWKEALDIVTERLRQIAEQKGPAALAGLASAHLTNEDAFLLARLWKERLGTPHVDVKPSQGRASGLPLKEDGLLRERDKAPNYQGVVDMALTPGAGGLGFPALLKGIKEGKIKALHLVGADLSRLTGAREALAGLDFLVVEDLKMTETAVLADVVLPAASFAEKDGTFTNSNGRVQRLRPVFPPVGQARADWEVAAEIACRLGHDFGLASATEVFDQIAITVPGYGGMSYERLGSLGLKKES